MPIILLGLLLLIGLLAYSIVRYIHSGEEDPRSVRERYPNAFPSRNSDGSSSGNNDSEDEVINARGYVDSDSIRGDIDYMLRNLKDTVKETVNDKAKGHGIDLSKFGRDPHSHNPYGDHSSKANSSAADSSDSAGNAASGDDRGKTIIFPTDNVEEEKRKRNIH